MQMHRNHSSREQDEYGVINYSPEEQSGELHHLGDLRDAVAYVQEDGSYKIVDATTGKLLNLSQQPITTKVEASFLAYERGYMIDLFYDKNGDIENFTDSH